MPYDFLSIVNLIMSIALSIGGVMAYRHGFAKTAGDIQDRVIGALQSEINAMKDRITELEKETRKLRGIIATIKALLKQHNLSLTIEGDVVILKDEKSNSSIISPGEEV